MIPTNKHEYGRYEWEVSVQIEQRPDHGNFRLPYDFSLSQNVRDASVEIETVVSPPAVAL